MNIIILFPNSFPIGASSTNRVIHIAKIIREGGCLVDVIITRGTERKNSIINTDTFGNYEGIPFTYSNRYTIWPEKKYKRLINVLLGVFRTIKLLIQNKDKIDILLSYADYNFFNNFIFFIFCKIYKIKFIYAVDEYPWVEIFEKQYSKLYKIIYLKWFFKLFDGIIVMTKTLEKYYKLKSSKNTEFFQLPMTVELDRFEKKTEHCNSDKFKIVYCGGGGTSKNNKDGLDILIQSFAKFSKNNINAELILIGKFKSKYLKIINENIKNSNIKILGYIKRDEIPTILHTADVLILTRPSSLQAEGGFPTKLGEYLATGIPVIVTKTGEISYYLSDNVSAFLSEPNSIESIVDKLNLVFNNKDLARRVGMNGRKVAENNFDYKLYSKSISAFLISIVNEK